MVIEAALISAGARSSVGVHWVSSFLVSLTVTAAVAATWLALMSAPAPGQLLWLPGLHLFAVFPDLVGRASSAHAGWANALLAHDAATQIPGGNRTLLAIATLATGTYGALLWAWISARRAETALGLAPGVGIGASGSSGRNSPRPPRRWQVVGSGLRDHHEWSCCTASLPRAPSGRT